MLLLKLCLLLLMSLQMGGVGALAAVLARASVHSPLSDNHPDGYCCGTLGTDSRWGGKSCLVADNAASAADTAPCADVASGDDGMKMRADVAQIVAKALCNIAAAAQQQQCMPGHQRGNATCSSSDSSSLDVDEAAALLILVEQCMVLHACVANDQGSAAEGCCHATHGTRALQLSPGDTFGSMVEPELHPRDVQSAATPAAPARQGAGLTAVLAELVKLLRQLAPPSDAAELQVQVCLDGSSGLASSPATVWEELPEPASA